jgi:predicted transcriptional regulator
MATISLRLPDELDHQLDREATAAERPKSELIRDAILAFLERQERGRFQHQLLRAARARGSAEALQVAEEFLPIDNEALALAESRMVREVRGRYRVKPSRSK